MRGSLVHCSCMCLLLLLTCVLIFCVLYVMLHYNYLCLAGHPWQQICPCRIFDFVVLKLVTIRIVCATFVVFNIITHDVLLISLYAKTLQTNTLLGFAYLQQSGWNCAMSLHPQLF